MFGTDDVTIDHIAKAIATFERTVLSGNSPYDRFKAGDKKALTESQKRGMDVFFSNNARCDSCHEGVNFTNGKYANVGIGMDKPMPDLGRFEHDQAGRRPGRVQDADPPRDRAHRPVHARRQPEDAGGSRRALQQGRHQEHVAAHRTSGR